MGHIPSLEANSSSASEEMFRRLWSSKFPCRGHKCTFAQHDHWKSTSRHPEFNVQFDIPPSTRSPSKWSRSSSLPTKKVMFISVLPHACLGPARIITFDLVTSIIFGEERFAPVSCPQCRYEQTVFRRQSHSGIAVCEHAHLIPMYFIHEGCPEPARSADLVMSIFWSLETT
jgi:hypothetical protein